MTYGQLSVKRNGNCVLPGALLVSCAYVVCYVLCVVSCMSRVASCWAVIWGGGVQNAWGEEHVPENTLSRKFWTPPKELLVCSVMDSCTGKTEH